jgi:hypothetical protein
MKIGMLDPKNYQPEAVIRGNASIPLKKAGFLCGLGILAGGPVFIIGLLAFLKLESPPGAMVLCITAMFLGMFLFFLGMTLPNIIYLSKELLRIKDCLCEECKTNLARAVDQEKESNQLLDHISKGSNTSL